MKVKLVRLIRSSDSAARSLCVFIVMFAVLMGAAAIVTIRVDPYSMFRTPLRDFNRLKIYDPPQQNAVYGAELKAADIIRDHPARIILGSSVAEGGFRTADDFYKLAKGGPIYNSAVRGANLATLERFLHHAYENNPKLAEVFFSFDWLSLSWANPPCCRPELEPTILGETYLPPMFLAGKAWSWHAVRDSLLVMDQSTGYALTQWRERTVNRLQSILQRVTPAAQPVSAVPQPAPFNGELLAARSNSELQRLVVLEQFARQWALKPHSDYLREDGFDTLRRIVEFCTARGIRLQLFMTPSEGAFWAAAKRTGIWPAYLEALRRIAAIHPFWDFAPLLDYDFRNADANFGGDLWHYLPPAGRLMMQRMLAGREGGDLFVTQQTLEDHLRRRTEGLDHWIAENPYPVRFVDHLSFHSLLLGSNLMPKLIAANYRGYHLVRQADHFYAFPGPPRTHDLVAVKEKAIPGVLQEDIPDGAVIGKTVRTTAEFEAAMDAEAHRVLVRLVDRHLGAASP